MLVFSTQTLYKQDLLWEILKSLCINVQFSGFFNKFLVNVEGGGPLICCWPVNAQCAQPANELNTQQKNLVLRACSRHCLHEYIARLDNDSLRQ